MRIVMGLHALTDPGGTESYCTTVARELVRLGHEVTIVAVEVGMMADVAREEGLDVAGGFGELPGNCDAVLANDAISAGLLAEKYPRVRLVYVVHYSRVGIQTPPFEAGVVHALVAPSELFAAHARSLALDVPVIRLTQPIDTLHFTPAAPPRPVPQRALLLGNYLEGSRRDAIVETWSRAGIECVSVGKHGRISVDVRHDIASADIVVAKARAALEAMACGKAVYVFDAFGGDGWVTPDIYPAMEADNFNGLSTPEPVDRARLEADLKSYDPDMGWMNRELVTKNHDAHVHVNKLLEVLHGPVLKRSPGAPSPGGTARSLHIAWRMQAQADVAFREAESLARTAESLRSQIAVLELATAELEAALRRATDNLAESEAREATARHDAANREAELRWQAECQAEELRGEAFRQTMELRQATEHQLVELRLGAEREAAKLREMATSEIFELRLTAARQAGALRAATVRQLMELRAELDAQIGQLTEERDLWQARTESVERDLARATRSLGSRRVRAALLVGSIYDQLRGRR